MEWCRLYARLRHDQAVQNLTDGQFRLFVESLCYATEAESDGHIPTTQLPKFGKPGSTRNATALAVANLWTRVDDGWVITKWQALQEDLETVRKRRKKDAERKATARASSNGVRSGVRGGLQAGVHEGVLPVDREEEKRATHQSSYVPSADAREHAHSIAGSITAAYAAGVPLTDHGRAHRTIAAALDAGYDPDLVRRGVGRLIAEQRTCTPDTLRIAIHADDKPPPGQQPRRRTATEKANGWLTVGLDDQADGDDRPALRALPGGAG